ncbi:MAG: precorrin-6y C5,15-methyltransferase (decarboxylating) subunit CbiE [Clostridia bacterium]
MKPIDVVGVGPGVPEQVTQAAREVIERADQVYAAKRHAHLAGGAVRPLGEVQAGGTVLVSGDPGLYSMLGLLKAQFGAENLRVTPGISALQMFCAALCESWQDACLLSVHGRDLPMSGVAYSVRTNASTILFCGPKHTPNVLADALMGAGLAQVEMAVGERLSYPQARITRGTPCEILRGQYDPLCMVRVRNPAPERGLPAIGLADDQLIRGKAPMTKREIRMLVVASLSLTPDAIVWDIGAGTGSVSVECARQCPWGQVYAVERDAQALALLEENKAKFCVSNLRIVPGSAPEALDNLPAPSHVFLGGSGGHLPQILGALEALSQPFRLVATAVSLDSAQTMLNWAEFDAVQVGVSRLEDVGHVRLFRAQNPVFVLSTDRKAK